MNRGTHPRRWVPGVLLGLATLARAQAPASPPAEPYRDRIIAPEQLAPLPPDEDETAEDAEATRGPPRSLRIDAGLSHHERGGEARVEHNLGMAGFWGSALWGDISLDANLLHRDAPPGAPGEHRGHDLIGAGTLWQRNLHIDGGWRVDNGLGVLATPALPMQRDQVRIFLPSVPFAGVASQWRQADTGLQLQAAYGRPGLYTGTRTAGFEAGEGHVETLGAQWAWAPGWTGAASYLSTEGRLEPGPDFAPVLEPGATRALHLGTAWTGAGHTLRFNLLGSGGDRRDARGAWVDGRSQRGRHVHQYGAYHLEPELAWGALPIQSNATGGYYRLDYDYGRWHWNGGFDALRPVAGDGDSTAYATGYVRYQATSALGLGGTLSLRNATRFAHAAQLFLDRRNRLGQTRLQLDQARNGGDDSWQLTVDHAFALAPGSRLSTSLGLGELRYRDAGDPDAEELQADDRASRAATFSLHGGRDLGGRLQLDGSLRWTHGRGADAVRGLDLNLGLDWRIARQWSLALAAYQSRGSRRSPFVLDPLVTSTPYLSLPRERSLLLTLRFHAAAGRLQPVLGGAPGAAVGGVRGSVFLDENRNGRRDASELPAANVTVVLDGRYSVLTDSAGLFTFERVAVGRHTLTAEPDALPLPWSFDEAAVPRAVEVDVRRDAYVEIGAQRPR